MSENGDLGETPGQIAPVEKQRTLSGFASKEHWSPERRRAQSEWAKKAHEEGRFGGKQPGAGRPKNKTVAEVIAEKAQNDGDMIYRELKAMVLNKSASVKLGAIDRILAAEQTVQKNMRDDEKEILKLSGKQLDSAINDALELLGANLPDVDLSPDDYEELPDRELTSGD